MLSESILFSNGRFELQDESQMVMEQMSKQLTARKDAQACYVGSCCLVCRDIGVQNAVTDLWRIMEKFGGVDIKI